MKIKFRADSVSFVVTSRQGNEILRAAYGEAAFDGDLAAMIEEFKLIQVELEETERSPLDVTI